MITEDHEGSQLNEKQRTAVELLVQGLTDGEVGGKVGACRETVCRWRNGDPHFIAELNQRRLEVWESNRGRIRGLISKALDVLEDRLDNGDSKVALEFLKRMDADLPPIGGTDADSVVQAMAQDEYIKSLGRTSENPYLELLRDELL